MELSHVSFRYNETMPWVLDDLSLKIHPGQYVAIVGKTGCGKSTLLRLLMGFETPQKGAVYYDGKKINYHKIWDGLSIRVLYPECGKDYELFSQKMDKYSAKKRAKICKGTLLDWAKDSGMRSRKIYSDVEPLDYLDRDFVLSYREMSETQAMYSAYRLAHLINEIFK
jgi:ABC-type cobalamin/Fe3+-siderophores transport system ATPase subunit